MDEPHLDRPDFGARIALRYALESTYPKLLDKPPYRWVRAAFRVLVKSHAGHEPDLSAARQAMHWHSRPEFARPLNAALLARDATAERVAAALDIPEPPVEAYASLCFDVLDRKEDKAYLQTAARVGMLTERWRRVPPELDPVAGEIFVIALNGTLANVMDAVRRSRPAA
ncbi:MAG: hypothetical protein J0M04_19825 [Verrucomicrobia bacterium]|nr:hypothetical protein [Verrucomicrobiota bacterium]